jgi:hypothetical protein
VPLSIDYVTAGTNASQAIGGAVWHGIKGFRYILEIGNGKLRADVRAVVLRMANDASALSRLGTLEHQSWVGTLDSEADSSPCSTALSIESRARNLFSSPSASKAGVDALAGRKKTPGMPSSAVS